MNIFLLTLTYLVFPIFLVIGLLYIGLAVGILGERVRAINAGAGYWKCNAAGMRKFYYINGKQLGDEIVLIDRGARTAKSSLVVCKSLLHPETINEILSSQ